MRLRIIDRAASRWPRPMLNPPHLVGNLDRDKLHRLLDGIEGLDIPATVCVTRAQLSDAVALEPSCLADIAAELAVSGHRPAARFACRRRARQDR